MKSLFLLVCLFSASVFADTQMKVVSRELSRNMNCPIVDVIHDKGMIWVTNCTEQVKALRAELLKGFQVVLKVEGTDELSNLIINNGSVEGRFENPKVSVKAIGVME